MSHLEVLPHFGAAEIEITIGETQVLVDLVAADVVERKRGRLGYVEDVQPVGRDLDLARGQSRIDGARWARDDRATDADDGLGLQVGGLGAEAGVVLGVELDLREAFAVAQIDEDNPAVVADGINPAQERDSRAEIGFGQLGTVVGALHGKGRRERVS